MMLCGVCGGGMMLCDVFGGGMMLWCMWWGNDAVVYVVGE